MFLSLAHVRKVSRQLIADTNIPRHVRADVEKPFDLRDITDHRIELGVTASFVMSSVKLDSMDYCISGLSFGLLELNTFRIV